MKRKLTLLLTYTTLAAMLVGGGTWLFWTFQPDNVIDVTNSPAPVRPDTINPEAVVIVSPNICKHIKAEAHVKRLLVSKALTQDLPEYANLLNTGCNTIDLPVIIPGNTPDGVYHLEYTVTYRINPIKTVVENWRSQEFTVHHDPPLPTACNCTVSATSDVTTTPSQTVTTTNDGRGNTTSTTTNNVQPTKKQNIVQKWFDMINTRVNKFLGKK